MKRLIYLALLLASLEAQAHYLYINLSHDAKPRSVMAHIGWGHTLPIDDFLQGDMLSSYSVYDPLNKRLDFKVDKSANANMESLIYTTKPTAGFPAASVFEGDSFARKLYFDEKAPEGVYQFAASNDGVLFSIWKDQKGRQKWGQKYLDELKDAKEINLCWIFKSYAKAFLTRGAWREPTPIGHELEFIPLSDLSNVKVGDEVEFKVLFRGEPLHNISPQGGLPDSIRAYNEHLGKTFIGAFVSQGRLKFKVLAPGRWLVTLGILKPADEINAPKLQDKILNVGYNATATFFVQDR